MKTKLFVLTLFLLAPFCARASVGFSEIMYDPQGTDTKHEWVEVYNSGPAAVDISKYKLNDGSSSTNHTLNAPPADGGTGSMSIPSGGYAILADDAATFLSDVPTFSGTVIDTTFTLLNSGATLALLSCPTSTCTTVDTVSYTSDEGGSNDGTTLQKNSAGVWLAGPPTPGSAYVASSVATQDPDPTDTSDDTDSSVSSDPSDGSTVSVDQNTGTATSTDTSADASDTTTVTASGGTSSGGTAPIAAKQALPVAMKASITLPETVTAGVPITILPKITGYYGEALSGGLFKTAFGDGSQHVASDSQPFSYTYEYPGTYVLKLQYWQNSYSTAPPDVCVRVTVTVAAPAVSATVNTDGSVTLTNAGSHETDLSGWDLQSVSERSISPFVIPEGTILLPDKSMTLPNTVVGSTLFEMSDLALYLPNGELASVAVQADATTASSVVASENVPADDSASVAVAAVAPVSTTVPEHTLSAPISAVSTTIPEIPDPVVATAALPAAASSANTPDKNAQMVHSLFPFAVGLFGVVGISVFAVRYFKVFSALIDTPLEAPDAADTNHVPDAIPTAENITIVEEPSDISDM